MRIGRVQLVWWGAFEWRDGLHWWRLPSGLLAVRVGPLELRIRPRTETPAKEGVNNGHQAR